MVLGPGVVASSIWLILPFVTESLLPDGKLILAQALSLYLNSSSEGLIEGPRTCLLDLNIS